MSEYTTQFLCNTLVAVMATFVGMQIQTRELSLLRCTTHYQIQKAQWVTFSATILAIALTILEICFLRNHIGMLAISTVIALLSFFTAEWLLSLLNSKSATGTWLFRLCIITALAYFIQQVNTLATHPITPFLLAGIFLRNSPFGIPFGKILYVASWISRSNPTEWKDAQTGTHPSADETFAGHNIDSIGMANAGNKHKPQHMSTYDVTQYGIHANSSDDQLDKVQKLINEVGEKGGGVIFFPKGKYLFNKGGDHFLQINHSNITIEGEVDSNGTPLAELINCGKTSRGHKNPWVSPFFITTGEQMQPSNEFWGLQFRNRKNLSLQSSSLSDPGSNGDILTPTFSTLITANANKGDTILQVKESSKVAKYILIGLYNTTEDGNLIKDILGISQLREEWITAQRAGNEAAPSYQWLVEVKRIIDEHTIELTRPLLRDFDMQYDPSIYNVEMLENIHIKNLRINSRWNGQFRHHGFPLYYSISRSQEMDYGWNAINLKRVAHSSVSHVIISNFTNPLYVMDSRNNTIQDIEIDGYDGHQGIKTYMHACDNLFQQITFRNHYADMMGGEGNSYGNVFQQIYYLNPVFNPVDYDFHGFSEGPMSPPSHNVFHHIFGFRYIKAAGAIFNLPSCAQHNTWAHCITEGEKRNDIIFCALNYRRKKGMLRIVTAIGFSVVKMLKRKSLSPKTFVKDVKDKLQSIDAIGMDKREHYKFFTNSHLYDIRTWSDTNNLDPKIIDFKKGQ